MKKFLIAFIGLSLSLSFGGSVFAQGAPDMTFTEEEAAAAEAAATPAASDQAQTQSAEESPTFRPPADFGYTSPVTGNLTGFINRLINFALGIVGAILLATFIYGGGSWMIASDPKEVQAAKATLKNAVIGMAIVTLSYTIVTAIFTLGNQVIQPLPAASDAETETPTPPATGG